MDKWDDRFLCLAAEVATWSKDPSTQTGAVFVRPDKTVASVGYNGFPSRLSDAKELYDNRDIKYERIIHCEMNALLHARERLDGYTLYTWPFLSCPRCASHMIAAGISRIVGPACPPDKLDRWGAELEKSKALFREAGVNVLEVVYEEDLP
jgi:dCMP deaminase